MPPIQAGIDVPGMGPGTGNRMTNQGLGQQPFDVFPVALVESHERASGMKLPGDYPEARLNVDFLLGARETPVRKEKSVCSARQCNDLAVFPVDEKGLVPQGFGDRWVLLTAPHQDRGHRLGRLFGRRLGVTLEVFGVGPLGDHFIQRAENGTLRVSTELGGPNLSQARQWFARLGEQGYDVSAIEQRLVREEQEWTTSEITEMGISAALAEIGKPSLNNLAGVAPGSAMGFDGWLPRPQLEDLRHHLERWAPAEDMGPIAVGRHDGLGGDRLMRAASLANPALLKELKDDPQTSPRIRAAAELWEQSPLLHRQRAVEIWRELREGPSKISNDLGQERPGMVSTFFGRQAIATFEHPRLGQVRADEVDQVVRQAKPEQRNELLESVLRQNTSPEGLPPAYQRLAQWLHQMGAHAKFPPSTMERTGALPPPPPLVAASGADLVLPTIDQWRRMRAKKDVLALEEFKAREDAERRRRQARGPAPMLGG